MSVSTFTNVSVDVLTTLLYVKGWMGGGGIAEEDRCCRKPSIQRSHRHGRTYYRILKPRGGSEASRLRISLGRR